MIWPVIVTGEYHQVFFWIQRFYIFQQIIPFFESAVTAAVDAKAHKTVFFQKVQSLADSGNTGVASGGDGVVAGREIAEIEYDA